MNITIKPLAPDLAVDYFDFFENRAFTDDSPYRCYCQMFQLSKEQFKSTFENAGDLDAGQMSRKAAEQQIESNSLRGYLAFVDGLAIGWCNVNDKANYPIDPCIGTSFYAPTEKREKAVVCFEIAPGFRGQGVATALLLQAIDDAKAEGYLAIEGFPTIRDERFEWDYTGPVRLYEKTGFKAVAEKDGYIVMRKELQ
ncbi:MAG: GNAT family N-acetyltransferase [Coriobacteriales bacterium]|jgi:GNAT superfamily N-acetyltransferase|nr:GNAT family N-acetyltransferase [Coriobacteriales bacterium]